MTLLRGKESENFLKVDYSNKDELMLAANPTSRLHYSNLKDQLDDIDETMQHDKEYNKSSLEKITGTLKKRASLKHAHHLDEVYDREGYLQMLAAREYMKRHFRNGADPPPLTFERGVVTATNMRSDAKKETEAEKKARQHAETVEARKL